MKKLLFLCGLVLLTKCITEPAPIDPKIIFYANSSVAQYLPFYIYLDSSFVGTLADTVKPFKTEFPPMSDEALLEINVTPGKHNVTIISLPAVQDTFTEHNSMDNMIDDIAINPDYHSTKVITVEMGQYVFQGIGQ